MSVEARAGGYRLLSEAIDSVADEVKEKLIKVASSLREGSAGIVNPPYNTPDGKPLEVHFFQPGEANLLDRKQTQAIIQMLEDT